MWVRLYKLDSGICVTDMTKLIWNKIDMDFQSGDSDQNVVISKSSFLSQ